jgi:hypothetical protein
MDRQREDIFKNLSKDVFQSLSNQPVLESMEGKLLSPKELTYATAQYDDPSGKPLIPPERSIFTYISHNYPKEIQPQLELLEVNILSDIDFLNDLQNFVTNHSEDFQAKPHEWHSRLAQILCGLVNDHRDLISRLNIIQLKDRQWAAPISKELLFPIKSSKLTIPKGLDVFEVHELVSNNSHRRDLAQFLNVKESSVNMVCDLIIKTHKSPSFIPSNAEEPDLLSHIIFLYQTLWNPGHGDINLWLVTENGRCQLSHKTYLDRQDSDVPYSATKMFRKQRYNVHFMSKAYFNLVAFGPSLISWLKRHLKVADLPHLVTPSKGETPFTLSDDFRLLLEPSCSLDVLLLFRHHWAHYSKWISEDTNVLELQLSEEEEAKEKAKKEMREKLSHAKVQDYGLSKWELRQTYLRRDSVLVCLALLSPPLQQDVSSTDVHESPQAFHSLTVPDPDDEGWNILENFGVVTKVNTKLFIERLQQLQQSATTVKDVSIVYKHLREAVKLEEYGPLK